MHLIFLPFRKMLQSLSCAAMPSLLRVAAAGCLSAYSRLNEAHNFPTGPARSMSSAVESPIQQPLNLQQILAAMELAAQQEALLLGKRPVKQLATWTETTKIGGLVLGPRMYKKRASGLLVSFAPVTTIHTQRPLEPEHIARLAIRALREAKTVASTVSAPAAGSEGKQLWEENPRYLGRYPELWSMSCHKLRQVLRRPENGYLEQMGLTQKQFESYDKDHIIPSSLGGPDHAGNLLIMPCSRNRALGASLTDSKVQEVGYGPMLAATLFYVQYHGLDDQLQQLKLLVPACQQHSSLE